MKFSNRAQVLSGSATMEATLLAQKKIQEGHDIILGTVGEPDGDAPQTSKDELINQIKTSYSKYGSAQGLPATRLAIANWMSDLYKQNWTEDHVIISPGSKYALFALFQMLCEFGDQVLIPAPYWVSYESLAKLSGASALIAPCGSHENYKLSAVRLQKYLNENPKIKILVLNSPNNPTGAVYSSSELKALALVIEKHKNLMVICDDIYNQLIFNSEPRAPHLLDFLSSDASERIIIVHGASKSFALTGWRLGWTVAHPELILKLSQFQSQTLTCVPDFLQRALVPTLKNGDSFVADLKKKVHQRHKLVTTILSQTDSIKVFPSEGAFYIWIELLKYGNFSSIELAKDIIEKVGVALVPGESFGCANHLRLSVTIPDEQVSVGAKRLASYFKL